MRRARAAAAAELTFHERPAFSVIIQSFKDHSGASARQPQLFAERLRAGHSAPPLQLIVNDDARDGAAAWQPYLSGPNDWCPPPTPTRPHSL